MAFSLSTGGSDEEEVISAINTTPLVDVMLVLLIIFLITIPVVVHNVPVKLPAEVNVPTKTAPGNITLSVDRDGQIYWGVQPVRNTQELVNRLETESVKIPQPEVLIRGDQDARYDSIGKIVFACQRAGILKLGFISQPPARGG